MQRNTVFFIVVKAVHVLGGFLAHHKELSNCTYSIWNLLSLTNNRCCMYSYSAPDDERGNLLNHVEL
jgi:hypothetical protein